MNNRSAEHFDKLFNEVSLNWARRYESSQSSIARLHVVGGEIQKVLTESGWDDKSLTTVLDFGCGPGIFGSIASEFADRVICMDRAKNMVESFSKSKHVLERIVSTIGGNFDPTKIEMKVGDETNLLDFPNANFNLIISIAVLEYVNSPLDTLSQFLRCLDNDGAIIATLPNPNSLFRKIEPPLNSLAVSIGRTFRVEKLKNRACTGFDSNYKHIDLKKEIIKIGGEVSYTQGVPLALHGIRNHVVPNQLFVIKKKLTS